MWTLRFFLISVVILSMHITPLIAAENSEFEAFKQQQIEQASEVKTEFDRYEQTILDEFVAYKTAYDEAFNQFKEKIETKWGEYKTGDRSVWISYTNNNSVRRTVDYKNGTITIEKISSAPQLSKQSQKDFMLELPNLLMETEAQAFQGDEIASQVEQTLTANYKDNLQQSKLSNRRVLDSLIPDLQSADVRIIGALSNQISETAKIDSHKSEIKGKTVHVARYKLPKQSRSASHIFADTISKTANKEELPEALIYAVIEAESNFNPLARSNAPAYGLMQIVPSSAGKDATRYLLGKPKLLAPSYLYNSDNNIVIGSAYLHVLYYEYFTEIANPVSRLYCSIAAYNTGAGNVARAFSGNTNLKSATPVINNLSPQEVFNTLESQLPHEETRIYINTVTKNINKYQPAG